MRSVDFCSICHILILQNVLLNVSNSVEGADCIYLEFALGGWITKWVASSGRVRKSRVRFPAAQKCWAQMEFVNIYQFWFHPMLKYACVYCVRFVLINLQHCRQPWR